MPFQEKKRSTLATLVLVTLFGFATLPVNATVVTDDCAVENISCTLKELVDGGTITIFDKLFDNWVFQDFASDPPVTIDTSAIVVTALGDDPLNPGIRYDANGQFSTTGPNLVDIGIEFRVSTTDGVARIKDNSLEINGYEFGIGNDGGVIEVFEDVLDANGDFIVTKQVTADNLTSTFELLDSAAFSPQASIDIVTEIIIGSSFDADTMSLDVFTQRFSQIPEPATLLLFGIGLAGIGFSRKM